MIILLKPAFQNFHVVGDGLRQERPAAPRPGDFRRPRSIRASVVDGPLGQKLDLLLSSLGGVQDLSHHPAARPLVFGPDLLMPPEVVKVESAVLAREAGTYKLGAGGRFVVSAATPAGRPALRGRPRGPGGARRRQPR